MIDENLIIQLLQLAVPFLFGSGIYWFVAKKKIRQFRNLIDVVDDALHDDKITETEFRNIFKNLKMIISN